MTVLTGQGIANLRLSMAFRSLTLPSGFHKRWITHKYLRQLIADATGFKIIGRRTPPKCEDLDDYMVWLIDNSKPVEKEA